MTISWCAAVGRSRMNLLLESHVAQVACHSDTIILV